MANKIKLRGTTDSTFEVGLSAGVRINVDDLSPVVNIFGKDGDIDLGILGYGFNFQSGVGVGGMAGAGANMQIDTGVTFFSAGPYSPTVGDGTSAGNIVFGTAQADYAGLIQFFNNTGKTGGGVISFGNTGSYDNPVIEGNRISFYNGYVDPAYLSYAPGTSGTITFQTMPGAFTKNALTFFQNGEWGVGPEDEFTGLVDIGTSGQVLTSRGVGLSPVWADAGAIASDSTTPYLIPIGEIFTNNTNRQNLFSSPIEVEGELVIDGELNDVSPLPQSFTSNPTPFKIPYGKIFTNFANAQTLFIEEIQVEGELVVEGHMVDMTPVPQPDPINEWGYLSGQGFWAASPSTASVAATASNIQSLAIGNAASATNFQTLAIGNNAQVSGQYSAALGAGAVSTGNYSTSIGAAAQANGTNATAIGTGAEATGHGCAIGAFAQTGNGIAIGYNADATGIGKIVIGTGCYGSGVATLQFGNSNGVSGDQITSIGTNVQAFASNTTVIGYRAQTTFANSTAVGKDARVSMPGAVELKANGTFSGFGSPCGFSIVQQRIATFDATPVELMTGDDNDISSTVQPSTPISLDPFTAYCFDTTIVATEVPGAPVSGDYYKGNAGGANRAAWNIKVVCGKDSSGASFAFVSTPVITVLAKSAGAATWDATVIADTVNGRPAFTVIGQASTTILWNATSQVTRIGYAT